MVSKLLLQIFFLFWASIRHHKPLWLTCKVLLSWQLLRLLLEGITVEGLTTDWDQRSWDCCLTGRRGQPLLSSYYIVGTVLDTLCTTCLF
jgi:hypothetical protein